jgi:hypothetical protein
MSLLKYGELVSGNKSMALRKSASGQIEAFD